MKILTKNGRILLNVVKRVIAKREILVTINHSFSVTLYEYFKRRINFVSRRNISLDGGGVWGRGEGGRRAVVFSVYSDFQRLPQKRLEENAMRFRTADIILTLEYLYHILITKQAHCLDNCRSEIKDTCRLFTRCTVASLC